MSGIRSEFNYTCQRLVTISGSIRAERHNGLSFEIVTFSKSANNHRRGPPPYRTTDEYRIIVIPVFYFFGYGRSGIAVLFFQRHFGTFSIISRVRYLRFNSEQIGSCLTDNLLSHTLCRAAPAEIGNQYLGLPAWRIRILSRLFRILWVFYPRCSGLITFIGRTSPECNDGYGHHQIKHTFSHLLLFYSC